MEKDYFTIGKKTTIDGINYYQPGCTSEGCIYKDEKAFVESPGDVCYIPEHAFDDVEPVMIDGEEYYEVEGYSRNELQELLGDGNFGDDEVEDVWTVEDFFYVKLEWAYPETYIIEMS